jgi:hypothetical protein
VTLFTDSRLLCASTDGQPRILVISPQGDLQQLMTASGNGGQAVVARCSEGTYLMGTVGMLYRFDAAGAENWCGALLADVMQNAIICRKLIEDTPGTFTVFGYRIASDQASPVILRFSL